MEASTRPSVTGIDCGGTFTDAVTSDGRLLKVPSSPDKPEMAVSRALSMLGEWPDVLCHGTTVATNLVVQRNGARVVLITTEGFRDVLEIRRQNRPNIYDLNAKWPDPLVPPERRLEAPERILFDGQILRELAAEDVTRVVTEALIAEPDAVAICLLFSYVNPSHERSIAQCIHETAPHLHVSVSSGVFPECGEYERTSATVLDAYVAPRLTQYLGCLSEEVGQRAGGCQLLLMNSNGYLVDEKNALGLPLLTMLSGPAAGVVGAHALAQRMGIAQVITMDVGGTSTDVSLVPGEPLFSSEEQIDGYPLGIPIVDIETIGAGGGSIIRLDAGGLLHVGPESAGASPGPACYGSGGPFTLTDVNLLLGRLGPSLLSGHMNIDPGKSLAAVEPIASTLGTTAVEVSFAAARIAASNIARAVSRVSLERGYDIRDFALMAFGGAGPQIACGVADMMGIRQVLVPPLPGLMAAQGLLSADAGREYRSSIGSTLFEPMDLEPVFEGLKEQARADLARFSPLKMSCFVDLRYDGQTSTLAVAYGHGLIQQFHQLHLERYGYNHPQRSVEVVSARLIASAPLGSTPGFDGPEAAWEAAESSRRVVYFNRDGKPWAIDTPVLKRQHAGCRLEGPMILEQYDSTVVIPPGWSGRTMAAQALLLTRNDAE